MHSQLQYLSIDGNYGLQRKELFFPKLKELRLPEWNKETTDGILKKLTALETLCLEGNLVLTDEGKKKEGKDKVEKERNKEKKKKQRMKK